jgi:hypothetical protein
LATLGDEDVDQAHLEKLSKEASQGKFVANAGTAGKRVRMAVQSGKTQSEVWEEVGRANLSSAVQSPSDAFTANYTSPKTAEKLKGYLDQLLTPVAEQPRVVGVIAAINGKVEAVDVFGSTPLFKKLWPKILKSHAFDAAIATGVPEAEKTCTIADAKEFLRAAMQAQVEKKDAQGGLVVTKRDSERLMSFSAAERDAPAQGMGGFGEAIHTSAYGK